MSSFIIHKTSVACYGMKKSCNGRSWTSGLGRGVTNNLDKHTHTIHFNSVPLSLFLPHTHFRPWHVCIAVLCWSSWAHYQPSFLDSDCPACPVFLSLYFSPYTAATHLSCPLEIVDHSWDLKRVYANEREGDGIMNWKRDRVRAGELKERWKRWRDYSRKRLKEWVRKGRMQGKNRDDLEGHWQKLWKWCPHEEMGIDIGRGRDEGERGFAADGHKRAREREMRKMGMQQWLCPYR